VQLGYQLAISVAAFAYSFVVSGALLLLMERVARLSLRTVEIEEMKGVDEVDIGETAYDWLQDNGRHGLRDGSFGEINQETEPKAEPVESVKEV
jgi:Ammonium Transporter Family